jgi:DNA-binding HxlR family transcriptional regulator
MGMAERLRASVCSQFHEAIELIGARWTGAIVHVLLRGTARYADLRAAVPDISDRMLSERLRELEEASLVHRHVSADAPVRVEYSLTEKGRALEPALTALQAWAEQWNGDHSSSNSTSPASRSGKATKARRRTRLSS